MYGLKSQSSDKLVVIKTDVVTKSFTWAQWDCELQSLYFIHFRKILFPIEGEEPFKKEESPTLSCLQFHENLPHETVVK